jgi:uncharacterized protein YjdB
MPSTRSSTRPPGRLAAAALAAAALAACSSPTERATLVAVELAPATPVVGPGGTVQLAAVARYSDGRTFDVTREAIWVAGTPAVATVSATGLVTGRDADEAGAAEVLAAYGGRDARVAIEVLGRRTVIGLRLSAAAANLAPGQPLQLGLTASLAGGTSEEVGSAASWASSEPGVATVDATGVVRGAAAGRATVTAAYRGLTRDAEISVSDATLAAISAIPRAAALVVGERLAVEVTGTWSDGTSAPLREDLAFASGAPAVAEVSPAAGVITARAPGVAQITAGHAPSGLAAAATVRVGTAALTAIEVGAPATVLPAGRTLQLVATGTWSDGRRGPVPGAVWTVDAPDVATVSAGGLATGEAGGTAVFTARAGAVAGSAELEVRAASLQALEFAPGPRTVPLGLTLALAVSGRFEGGVTLPLGDGLSWASRAPGVATVSAAGVVTPVSAGRAAIRVTDAASGASAEVEVTVTGAALREIAVEPAAPVLAVGRTVRLAARGTYADGTAAPLERLAWTSLAPDVATVVDGVVLARAPGSAAIRALDPVGNVAAGATVTVVAAERIALEIDAGAGEVPVGLELPLAATALLSDGTVAPADRDVAWDSLDPSVATVSVGGVVSARARGPAAVRVTDVATGRSSRAGITVLDPVALGLAASPALVTVYEGGSATLAARALLSDRTAAPAAASWSAADALGLGLAPIDGRTGEVQATGLATGTVVVTASLGDLTASAEVVVAGVTHTPATLPAALDVAAGETAFVRVTGLEPGAAYDVRTEPLPATGNLDLLVSPDPAFARVPCFAFFPGARESCPAVANGDGELFVAAVAFDVLDASVELHVDVMPVVDATVLAFPAALPAAGIAGGFGAEQVLYGVTDLAPGARYEVSLTADDDVDLLVFRDPALVSRACRSITTMVPAEERCTAEASALGALFVLVDAQFAASGTAFTLDLSPVPLVEPPPPAPPALAADLWTLPFSGTARPGERLGYRVRGLRPLELHAVSAGALAVTAYGDPAFAERSCGPAPGCLARASATGDLHVEVDGGASGGDFLLAAPPAERVGADSFLDLPLAGTASRSARVHAVTGLFRGDIYRFRLGGVTGDVALAVAADPGFLEVACASDLGPGDEACVAAVGPSGRLWVLADGSGAAAAEYHVEALTMSEIVALSSADLPHVTAVDVSSAFYEVTGLAPGARVTVEVVATADLSLQVYRDPDFLDIANGSDVTGSFEERVPVTVPPSGALYVLVDGQWTVAGATFRLDVR